MGELGGLPARTVNVGQTNGPAFAHTPSARRPQVSSAIAPAGHRSARHRRRTRSAGRSDGADHPRPDTIRGHSPGPAKLARRHHDPHPSIRRRAGPRARATDRHLRPGDGPDGPAGVQPRSLPTTARAIRRQLLLPPSEPGPALALLPGGARSGGVRLLRRRRAAVDRRAGIGVRLAGARTIRRGRPLVARAARRTAGQDRVRPPDHRDPRGRWRLRIRGVPLRADARAARPRARRRVRQAASVQIPALHRPARRDGQRRRELSGFSIRAPHPAGATRADSGRSEGRRGQVVATGRSRRHREGLGR